MEGVGYDAISEMDPEERSWFVRRLHNQIKRENEEIKKAGRVEFTILTDRGEDKGDDEVAAFEQGQQVFFA